MARVFLRLKLALLRGRFAGPVQVKIGMLLSLAFGLPGALLAAFGLAVAGRATDLDAVLAIGTTAALTMAWTLGPPLLFGIDDTLDPARLAPLPLTRPELATGMLAASVVGVGPLVTTIVLVGLLVGVVPVGIGAGVVVVALGVQLVLCLVVSRLVTTALSDLLRSRRGRDLAGLLLAGSLVVLPQVPNLLASSVDAGRLQVVAEQLARVVGLTPLGWLGRAVADAAGGALLSAVAWLVAGASLTAALAWAWLVSLDRLTTRTPRAPASSGSGAGLFAGPTAVLSRTRVGATAAKELRYYVRDPRHRVAMLVSVGFGLVLLVGAVTTSGGDPRAVLAVAATGLLLALNAINLFGVDGSSTAQVVLAGGDHRQDLAGKNLALGVVAAVVVTVEAVVVAALVDGWAWLPAAVVGTAGLVTLAMGVGNVSSVLIPAPQAEIGNNTFASASGDNVVNGLLQAVVLLVVAVVAAPFAVVAFLVADVAGVTLVAAVAAGIGLGARALGTRIGARILARRGPELLADLRGVA